MGRLIPKRKKHSTLAKTLVYIYLLCCVIMLARVVMAAEVQWSTMVKVRPAYTTGFGPVIDDLEQHSDGRHPMRNENDPANWAHELTHQLNSDLRQQTREHDNCFYVFGSKYIRLMEPDITLRQVARMVPVEDRGDAYQTYFVDSLRWWNDEPLYTLDELCAYLAGMQYNASIGERDAYCEKLAGEFVVYSSWLVKAVEKYNPDYDQLGELRVFVEWSKRRFETLKERLK